MNDFAIVITIADLFYVAYEGLSQSMTSHPPAIVHFRDVEHLHLTDTHFPLGPNLNSCIYASVIAGK